ncbi:MAG TPA: DUF4178 domain-containing protein [Polyangia bacterium]|jgi:hypothetical protein|nr:DUF4178 domain-containing protein [Polyangia bacterium]
MKIQVRDVVSYLGRDYIVEGVVTSQLNGRTYPLARAVDGDAVLWIEPLRDDMDDRLLVLREVRDLEMSVPPPESINYNGLTYVQRLYGRATTQVMGVVPGRAPGSYQVWRYRAAGDLYIQIEEGGGRVFMLAGESVAKGMIDILPGK